MRSSNEIIKIIKNLRENKKMSLEELSKRVGIAKSTLSRYENGQRDFPINDIGKYAMVLEVSVEHLLGIDGPSVQLDKFEGNKNAVDLIDVLENRNITLLLGGELIDDDTREKLIQLVSVFR